MAFTRNWDESTPTGSEAASDIDKIIRELKVDIRERLEDVSTFGTDQDPLQLTTSADDLAARVERTTNQSITAAGGVQEVVWESEIYDQGSFIDLSSSDTQFSVPVNGAGLWLVNCHLWYGFPGSTARVEGRTELDTGSGFNAVNSMSEEATTSVEASLMLSTILNLSDGDTIRIVTQTAADIDLLGQRNTSLQMMRLGQSP